MNGHDHHDLHDRLMAMIRGGGVEVDFDATIPTKARTEVTPRGYRISVSREVTDPSHRTWLLLHEVSHILRGDLTCEVDRRDLWNVAADANINHHLPRRVVEELEGVRWENLAPRLGMEGTAFPPPTRILYERMLGRDGDGGSLAGPGHEGCGGSCSIEGTADSVTHASTILRLRQADADLAGSLGPGMLGRGVGLGGGSNAGLPVEDTPAHLEALRKVLAALDSGRGPRRRFGRSWMRPGRIEGLRGSTRTPEEKVVIAVDVSGSTHEYHTLFRGVTRWAERRGLEVVKILWATSAARVHRWDQETDVGGGTQVQSVWRLVEAENLHRHQVVVVTDGEVWDWEPCSVPRLVVVSPVEVPVGIWVPLERRPR